MKRLKYIFLFLLAVSVFSACEEKTKETDLIADGINLAAFELSQQAVTEVADGTEYPFMVKMKVKGPSIPDLSGDITVTVAVDPASTAVEGTHFRIDSKTITIKEGENYLGLLPVTLLTQGIATPLAASPVLILKVTTASGNSKVTYSAKKTSITLNYACPSFLEGNYSVNTVSSSGGVFNANQTIVKLGVGQYLSQHVGTWNPPLNANYGFIFTDVCNVITVPQQNLADMYSNKVYSHKAGTVDPATGVMVIYYTIEFTAGNRTYTATFTPLK